MKKDLKEESSYIFVQYPILSWTQWAWDLVPDILYQAEVSSFAHSEIFFVFSWLESPKRHFREEDWPTHSVFLFGLRGVSPVITWAGIMGSFATGHDLSSCNNKKPKNASNPKEKIRYIPRSAFECVYFGH